jgi:hypothetical protein
MVEAKEEEAAAEAAEAEAERQRLEQEAAEAQRKAEEEAAAVAAATAAAQPLGKEANADFWKSLLGDKYSEEVVQQVGAPAGVTVLAAACPSMPGCRALSDGCHGRQRAASVQLQPCAGPAGTLPHLPRMARPCTSPSMLHHQLQCLTSPPAHQPTSPPTPRRLS